MTNLQNRRILLAISSLMIVLGANLFSYSASAQNLTIPNTFASGTPAVAAEVNENFDAVAMAVNGFGGQTSTADVLTFFLEDEVTPAAGDMVGTAELTRTGVGVRLKIDTTALTPGAAYGIWWIIFNNPGACTPLGCGNDGADFGNPDVEASIMNATGRVADANGNATFSAFLPVGFMHTEPASGNIRQLLGPGLQNVQGAEIHVVVRDHGLSTGNIEQLSTLLGDCNTSGPTGCFDAQFAVFQPAM
jgi:hypothetical protein